MSKLLLLAPLLTLLACAGTAPRVAAPPDTTLSKAPTPVAAPIPAEDVVKYRATYPVPKPAAGTPAAATKTAPTPTSQVNAALEQRLRDQAYTNQNVKYASGYRVLVYLGIEREQAMGIRRAIIGRYPEQTDYLSFKAPVYRLYIGDYLTRLEAARMLANLRPLTQKAELEAMQVLVNKQP